MQMARDTRDHHAELRSPEPCHWHPSSLMLDHISAPHPDTQDPRAPARCECLEPQDRTGPQLDVTHPPRIQRCWTCGVTHAPQEKDRTTSSHRGSCWLLGLQDPPGLARPPSRGPSGPLHVALRSLLSSLRPRAPASPAPPHGSPELLSETTTGSPRLSCPHAAHCPSCASVALPATG